MVEFDGVFYCYATTDGEGKHLSTSGLPVVWKSTDFLNWSFEGSLFPPGFNGKYWAPSSAIRRDGIYYLYPTINEKLTVVTAKSPTGPFLHPETNAPGWKVITTKAGGSIDAEVLLDDDGKGYMVWQHRGFGKMRPDLLDLEPEGQMEVPTKQTAYAEGQYIFKRKGIYYFLYTQGGDENYKYAYMMSRKGIDGPWTAPEHDIISITDHEEKVFGPGHGSFFNLKGTDQWYFVYLEFGRRSTNRQVYADRMYFNADGTIKPIKLTKAGVGALRPTSRPLPNRALKATATASSTRPELKIEPNQDPKLDRTEFYAPGYAADASNGSRWMATVDDKTPWLQLDLGEPTDIVGTESYFVQPTHGHAYKIESSLDGKIWQPYAEHTDARIQSPHQDKKTVRTRYLRLTILQGTPGIWEFRIY
jgi:beta-xylosidase